jgi:hypothetical protein
MYQSTWASKMLTTNSSPGGIDSTSPIPIYAATVEGGKLADDEVYVGTEAICRYMSGRGLKIGPGSSFAEISMTQENSFTPRTILFDEMLKTAKVVIDVAKLLSGKTRLRWRTA